MAASLRKMGVFFGLTEDDSYPEAYADQHPALEHSTAHDGYDDGYGRTSSAVREDRDTAARPARVRPDYARIAADPAPRDWEANAAVEPYAAEYAEYVEHDNAPSAPPYRITTLHPRTYNEAVTIGEHFRSGTPVIMNLSEMADSDAKRLVDFAAGLTFGLRGRVERVTAKVFLLSPPNVDVTAQDKARIAENGFFNQS